ncbi:MAG: GAF domain-containing protein [Candidatus Nanopelagicales bacterium]|jgi:transcriptional regulator of acetoin/glycerol metabolism
MTNPWVALPSGSDARDAARSLARAHSGFLIGDVPGGVRDVVLDSWRRSRAVGLDPDSALAPVDLLDDDLAAYRDAHPLSAVMPVVRRLLVDDAVDTDLLVAVSDEHGRLLWVEGAPGLRSRAETMNFVAGARWDEANAGTNAPGTALATDHAVQIFGHEHWTRIVQPWSCAAAPIHDPATGRILGVLDVTGGDVVAAPHSLALVQAAVHAIETELRLQAIAPPPRARRLSAPRSTARRLEVLGVDHGVLNLAGARRTLSQRHSEIVTLLALHPQGLTTEQLAVELSDDDLPLVTVRAEMSRLRSTLGDLAPTSRPYQLPLPLETDAGAVAAHLKAGQLQRALRTYRGPLLPHSDAPGIARARRRLHDQMRAAVLGCDDAHLMLAWGETPWGGDDADVWSRALHHLPPGSSEHNLARLRLAALDDEFS